MMFHLNRRTHREGFTVLEMMIAMAVTLLMMAALGRAFKLIGDTMKSSRANVEMSSRLRTISYRIRDELARCTVKMRPPRAASEGEGYFVYYDGPMTDSTTIQEAIVGSLSSGGDARYARNDFQKNLASYFPLSRYGDMDDYLAFTAAAEDNAPFKGIVPKFVILYKERELARQEALRQGMTLAQVNSSLPYPPAIPGGDVEALTPVVIESNYAEIAYWLSPARDSNGAIIDIDNDFMPDRVYLRRRVLLIRPDLNSTTAPSAGFLPTYTDSSGKEHFAIGSGLRPLTVVHAVCDLSVRRPENANGVPLPVGMAVTGAIGNSISDLTLPHNRFAHIRIPERVAPIASDVNGNGTEDLTSMPILDLNGAEGFMALAPIVSATDSLRKELGGFLNPAYELGGSRLGEDIALANIVGFDLRGYDSMAPIFLHSGTDGVPVSNGDANGDGVADNLAFFGTNGSDDVIVDPNDPGFYAIIRGAVGSNGSSITLTGRGAFVDLNYVYKSAGNVMAPLGLDSTSLSGNPLLLKNNLIRFCETPLSGFTSSALLTPAMGSGWMVPENFWRSGKLVLGTANSGIRSALINQVTYDTWAADYETDQHNQGVIRGNANVLGTLWPYNDRFVNGSVSTYDPRTGLNWPNQLDEGANGIDEPGSGPGVDDPTEMEVPPPFTYALPGVQVRIRIIDPSTQEMRQTGVTQFFRK